MKPQIHIPQPCPENWNTMIPKEDGRYCNTCDKVVVDFTSMSGEEIKQYFLLKPIEKTCGQFYKHQVGLEKSSLENSLLNLHQSIESRIKQKVAKRAFLLIIGFTLSLMGCRQKRYGGAPAWNHATVRYLDEPGYKPNTIDTLKRNK